MLTSRQLDEFHRNGHLTVGDILSTAEIDVIVRDAQEWGEELLAALTSDEAQWYLETHDHSERRVLRKMDNPVFHRSAFRDLAANVRLVTSVEQLIGSGVIAFFSQIFCKPPEVGGPKPVHQDNFYFGPEPADSMLTAWVAMDDATEENGCLQYGDGSHLRGLLPHTAPEDRPFDLRVSPETMAAFPMVPAPVPRGGVSFHHGLTLHQSGRNSSPHPRRAVAIHYLRSNAKLAHPALAYDDSLFVSIPSS